MRLLIALFAGLCLSSGFVPFTAGLTFVAGLIATSAFLSLAATLLALHASSVRGQGSGVKCELGHTRELDSSVGLCYTGDVGQGTPGAKGQRNDIHRGSMDRGNDPRGDRGQRRGRDIR